MEIWKSFTYISILAKGTSLTDKWLGLCTLNAKGLGLITGWGTEKTHKPHSAAKLKNVSIG